MARKRVKKRTHAGANNPLTPATIKGHADPRDPKSMVIRMGAGEVGASVSQLAADVRQVMEPGTATRLRERKANRLRDYVTMCGPLGVTHLLLFSRSAAGNTNLRLATAPRGPTFHFRIEKYSLCKDVLRAQRRPRGGGKEYDTPPLLVMNNFTTPTSTAKSKVPRHLESLATTAFQSLFPPINPQTTPLKSIRRVLLLNRETTPGDEENSSFILNFRHFAITTKAAGISKPLKRLSAAGKVLHSQKARKGRMPNLHKLQDISDFLIGGENGEGYMTDGATSGSEMDTDAEVEVLETAPRKVLSTKARALAAAAAAAAAETGTASLVSRKGEDDEVASQATTTNTEHVERRAVKLVELGPRMRLRMTKVEEGLCSGKIMWHEYVEKSKGEVRELERRWEERRKEKEARKTQQKENVAKKQRSREEAKKAGKKAGGEEGAEGEESSEDDDGREMDMDEYDSDLFDEVEEGGNVSDDEMGEDE